MVNKVENINLKKVSFAYESQEQVWEPLWWIIQPLKVFLGIAILLNESLMGNKWLLNKSLWFPLHVLWPWGDGAHFLSCNS